MGSEEDTKPDNERPEVDVSAGVVANAIREQLEPFLRRQEERDIHVLEMVRSLVNQVVELAHVVGKLESRMREVELRCAVEHGPMQIGRKSNG